MYALKNGMAEHYGYAHKTINKRKEIVPVEKLKSHTNYLLWFVYALQWVFPQRRCYVGRKMTMLIRFLLLLCLHCSLKFFFCSGFYIVLPILLCSELCEFFVTSPLNFLILPQRFRRYFYSRFTLVRTYSLVLCFVSTTCWLLYLLFLLMFVICALVHFNQ